MTDINLLTNQLGGQFEVDVCLDMYAKGAIIGEEKAPNANTCLTFDI